MVNPIGYFKTWRELFSKPIWLNSTPEQCKILFTLLSMANFNGKEWEWKGNKFVAEKGQFITSLDSIKENCGKGITIQNIRTALTRFEKLGFLTNESTKTGRLITIVNWGLYQPIEDKANIADNKDLTKSQQTANKDLTPREEVKKEKKEIKNAYTQDFEEWYGSYPRTFNKSQSFKNWLKLLKTETKENIIAATDKYKSIIKKDKTPDQYITNSANFIGEKQAYIGYLEEVKAKPIKPPMTFENRGNL